MFRLWGIVRKNNKIIKDMVASSNNAANTADERLHQCIQEICYSFDLERPIWLPKNQRDYEDYNRVVLNQDNFIESVDFDTMELELIEDM